MVHNVSLCPSFSFSHHPFFPGLSCDHSTKTTPSDTGSENGDEELVLGGEGAWLGMRGTVLLDKKLNSPTRAPAGKQSLPHEEKGDGGATFKGVELSELGTEVDRLEFNSMINQGVVFGAWSP